MDHRRSLQSGVSMGGNSQNINMYRNCLKAYVYLITWYLQEYSRLKESKEA